jgi:hypothetical protein
MNYDTCPFNFIVTALVTVLTLLSFRMSNKEDFDSSDSSNDVTLVICKLAGAAATLGELHVAMYKPALVVNHPLPIPNLIGRQWLQRTLENPKRCHATLCMSPTTFIRLHQILVENHGLQGTRETGSLETLAMFVWTCTHNEPYRQIEDKFHKALGTISTKVSHVADVMMSFADTILVPKDDLYSTVHEEFMPYAPFFDG